MARDEEQTFLFADLAGFVALTEVHGDDFAADAAADFCAGVRQLLPECFAEEVKTIGDSVMVRVPDADDAICLAVRIISEVGRRHGALAVRVGVHTGAAVRRHGDWFGATVNLAARISAVAGCDEVLVSEATLRQAGTVDGITIRERGRRSLRNVAEPVLLFEVLVETERSTRGLPIDPVCRMAVDPKNAAGSLQHSGVTYYFCSLPCVHSFAEQPDRYTSDAGSRHRG